MTPVVGLAMTIVRPLAAGTLDHLALFDEACSQIEVFVCGYGNRVGAKAQSLMFNSQWNTLPPSVVTSVVGNGDDDG